MNTLETGTILIVDDEANNLTLMNDLLLAQGHTVLLANDGKTALSLLNQSQVDIILSDVIMPEMDGYELCLEIKKNNTFQDIPFIFLTGMTDSFNEIRAFEAGAVDFITKPIRKDVVLARIQTHLSLLRAREKLTDLNTVLREKFLIQKNIEKDLLESEQRFRAIADAAFEGIVIHEQGRIMDMNKAAEEIFLYSSNEIHGLHLENLVTAKCYEKLKKGFTSNETKIYDMEGIRKSGEIFPIEIHAKNIHFKGKHLRVAAMRDVTDERIAEQKILEQQKELKNSYEETERILENILPEKVLHELKQKGKFEPVSFASVTVLFTDFSGFTQISAKMTPKELLAQLDLCFSYFDTITDEHKMEKLKTIGDSYMCAGGIPESNKTHAVDAVLAALEMTSFIEYLKMGYLESNKEFGEYESVSIPARLLPES